MSPVLNYIIAFFMFSFFSWLFFFPIFPNHLSHQSFHPSERTFCNFCNYTSSSRFNVGSMSGFYLTKVSGCFVLGFFFFLYAMKPSIMTWWAEEQLSVRACDVKYGMAENVAFHLSCPRSLFGWSVSIIWHYRLPPIYDLGKKRIYPTSACVQNKNHNSWSIPG